jgi:hypothetical protein
MTLFGVIQSRQYCEFFGDRVIRAYPLAISGLESARRNIEQDPSKCCQNCDI